MTKTTRHPIAVVGGAAVAAAALLAGCGGGGGDGMLPPAPVTEVPASAGASIEAYTQYVGSLPASETDLPLGLGNIPTAPTSETAAPLSL